MFRQHRRQHSLSGANGASEVRRFLVEYTYMER
jgi:hypothetical protein